jgi:hypothetical protein
MSKGINFKPLFDYLDEQFGEVKLEITEVKQGVYTLQNSADGLAKMVKEFKNEQVVTNQRLETQEIWAKKVSKKVGISLLK